MPNPFFISCHLIPSGIDPINFQSLWATKSHYTYFKALISILIFNPSPPLGSLLCGLHTSLPVGSVGPSLLWLSVQETQLLTILLLLLSWSHPSDTNLQLCITRIFCLEQSWPWARQKSWMLPTFCHTYLALSQLACWSLSDPFSTISSPIPIISLLWYWFHIHVGKCSITEIYSYLYIYG